MDEYSLEKEIRGMERRESHRSAIREREIGKHAEWRVDFRGVQQNMGPETDPLQAMLFLLQKRVCDFLLVNGKWMKGFTIICINNVGVVIEGYIKPSERAMNGIPVQFPLRFENIITVTEHVPSFKEEKSDRIGPILEFY